MNRMQVAMAAAGLVAAASTALAQPSTPPGAAAPDPQRLELARAIMQANGGTEALQTQLKSMFGSIAKLTRSAMPAGSSPQASALADGLMKNMQEEELKSAAALIDDTASVYAEHLTTQELKDMLAYARSPSAQSIRAKMPAIMEEALMHQAPLLKRMTSNAVKTAIEKTCDDAHCTADQRQALNAVATQVAPAS